MRFEIISIILITFLIANLVLVFFVKNSQTQIWIGKRKPYSGPGNVWWYLKLPVKHLKNNQSTIIWLYFSPNCSIEQLNFFMENFMKNNLTYYDDSKGCFIKLVEE